MIIKRLKELFSYLGLNQSEAADRLGIRQQNLSLILNGKRPFGTNMQRRVLSTFGVSKEWLLEGNGEMFIKPLPDENVLTPIFDTTLVPLFNLEAVAGFDGYIDTEYVEGMMSWPGAQKGDFAIHVTGNSMTPRIPDGSIVLARQYPFTGFDDIDFGRVHIVVTDGCAMIKVLKFDPDHPGHVLLVSYNEEYPIRSLPASEIRHLYLAVSVQVPL